MGTDIYLHWEKQTEHEEKNQITGMVNKGERGYLRASIGMIRENQMLRILFPEEYWDPNQYSNEHGLFYDFEKNKELLQKSLAFYIHNVDEEDTITESLKQQMSFGMTVMNALSGFEGQKIVPSNKNLNWFSDEVKKFYSLGLEKNKNGLKTSVYISW